MPYEVSPAVCLYFVRQADDENNQFRQLTARKTCSLFHPQLPIVSPIIEIFKYSDFGNLIANASNIYTGDT